MAAPDRLADLQKQRTLIQEHLAWLDREIESESKRAAESREGSESSGGTLQGGAIEETADAEDRAAMETSSTPPSGADDPDAFMEQFRVAPRILNEDVRKGCAFYFFGALALVAVVIVVLYLALMH